MKGCLVRYRPRTVPRLHLQIVHPAVSRSGGKPPAGRLGVGPHNAANIRLRDVMSSTDMPARGKTNGSECGTYSELNL